jgi:excisionase family DNA binding protein
MTQTIMTTFSLEDLANAVAAKVIDPVTESVVGRVTSSVNDSVSKMQGMIHRRDIRILLEKEYLTVKETCKVLSISPSTCVKWTKKGKLKPFKVGSRLRYRTSEILEILRPIEMGGG